MTRWLNLLPIHSVGLGEVALGAKLHGSQGQVGSLACGRAEPGPFACGWIYCQLLGAADVGYSVSYSVLAPCIPLSVSEAVAQLAQVVLLCTRLVTGSALMAMLT